MVRDKDTATGDHRHGQVGYSAWFVLVTALFVTALITANIIAVKIISLSGVVLTAAIVIFPLSYVFGDVLTEVYGYRRARRVIWLGFLCNAVTVAAIWLTQALPPASFWDGQGAYERILGSTPRILGASFVAYLAGEFVNSFVLAKMKIATKGRWLWMRTIGSTLAGQGIDSVIFMTLAFAGTMPAAGLGLAMVNQWLAKSAYEALITPVTYRVVAFLKRAEGIDTYDYTTRFSPFTLSD
jgi:hypothetical protein